MIDIWFKDDLKNIYENHNVAVFIDESGNADFLIKCVENEYIIYQANTEVEELRVKFIIEKAQPSKEKFLIYTRSKKEDLKFIREYCETNGSVEIPYLQNYVKDKVHQTLNLNINLASKDLIAAAKVSVGKDNNYWIDIIHKGPAEIFDLSKEILSFVHDPESYSKDKYDEQLRETFYRKVNDLLGQEYIKKPSTTLADEVVKAMLECLAENRCNDKSETVYKNWLDSVTYRGSFQSYLNSYSLPAALDYWNVSIDHPFRKVDEKWLEKVGKNISDKQIISKMLPKLRQRNQSKQAHALGICFWADVLVLLDFDPQDIAYLSSLNECVEFYKKHFYKLDNAIRNLYVEFLNMSRLLEPFQELYKEYVTVFLDKWIKYWDSYHETQTGILQRIIDGNNDGKIAVIVGDGVTYGIAEQVAGKIKGNFDLKRGVILADFPSDTENNMSRIYMDNGVTEPLQSNRERYLTNQNLDKSIDFVRLDEVNEEPRSAQYLICTYKDIDDIGEKLQQKALKYFPETINFFAEKISLLLSNGYAKVYLISDHGFVLTGLLSEADKVSPNLKGEVNKTERYISTKSQQTDLTTNLIEVEKNHKQFNYLYFSETINPFKTTGLYGYSHGGISPQELVTPYFYWESSDGLAASLSVIIENKDDLKDVTGEWFIVQIKADEGTADLFSYERKVCLVFFENNRQVNKSDILTIQRGEHIAKEYSFDGHQTLQIHLLDANSKQLLDRAEVRQNMDRDFGGLL